MTPARDWPLRSYLSALLVATMLVALAIVGAIFLLVRVPQIERESHNDVVREVSELTARVELLLSTLETRLQLLSQPLQAIAPQEANAMLDLATGSAQAFRSIRLASPQGIGRAFRAIYLVSPQGIVLAAGVAEDMRAQREDLIGSDLSANPLFLAVKTGQRMVWGTKYLSALSGAVTVGLAMQIDQGRVLLAEVPLTWMLSTVQTVAGSRDSFIWLVDRTGEIIAETRGDQHVSTTNVLNLPLLQAAIKGEEPPQTIDFRGQRYHAAISHSIGLDWYFIGGIPAGRENKDIRQSIAFVLVGLLGSMGVGLLMAPFAASWLSRPLRQIVVRAGQITQGREVDAEWPRGAIAEFNHLSSDLGTMAATLREREQQLRALNADLESRVARRTRALAAANEELSEAVAKLRRTQDDLVRSAKMAALGSLVAGVAHELNTPIGNSLMAASSLGERAREFRRESAGRVSRARLDDFIDGMAQGADIASRNLHRAAELVTSFKQVSVDQTSSQRRTFELKEVADEMVISLRPTFSRMSHRIVVDMPERGIRLDSYPGALGQVIGNLISNAVLHGFEGREGGTIQVSGGLADDGQVVLRVTDDGKGIPAHMLERIFDPFVTSRMGRGGTGLGLHIAYNAVTNILGGTLGVQSTEGVGTVFTVRIPAIAPKVA